MWDKSASSVGLSLHTGSKFMDFSIFSTKVCEKSRFTIASWYHISNHFNNVIICKKSKTSYNNYVILTFCRHNIANDIDLEKSI